VFEGSPNILIRGAGRWGAVVTMPAAVRLWWSTRPDGLIVHDGSAAAAIERIA
jgi:hypothetical protein